MPSALNLRARLPQVAAELAAAMSAPGTGLAAAAFALARIEYPALDPAPYFALLDRLGAEASARLRTAENGSVLESVRLLNEYLYDEQGFSGNRQHYEDPRNSFLHEVLDRRTGIPISLATVYLEVARRAGLHVEGVNFPGHFLLRVPVLYRDGFRAGPARDYLIVDPFHGGALLGEAECRQLLRQHVGEDNDFDADVLRPASRQQIVMRVLVNLKRLYVRMGSFPQAKFVTELLLSLDPSSMSELRDRGLLAYHLEEFAPALRDLETYLRLLPPPPPASGAVPEADAGDAAAEDAPAEDDAQLWVQVKALRRRVAGFN
jgi:regulator of sirC expression with transglutaminase-like and TPR domain